MCCQERTDGPCRRGDRVAFRRMSVMGRVSRAPYELSAEATVRGMKEGPSSSVIRSRSPIEPAAISCLALFPTPATERVASLIVAGVSKNLHISGRQLTRDRWLYAVRCLLVGALPRNG